MRSRIRRPRVGIGLALTLALALPPVVARADAPARGTAPPKAAFTTDDLLPVEGRPLKAQSTSTDGDGSIVSWLWDTDGDDAFDDGTGPELDLQLPAGEHSVGLKVTDNDGLSADTHHKIRVSADAPLFTLEMLSAFSEHLLFIPGGPPPPPATALAQGNKAPVVRVRVRPRHPRVGEVALLDARRTHDNGKVVSFEWDLNNDGVTDDAIGAKVRTVFDRAGNIPVAVAVSDNLGLGSLGALTVKVRKSKPLAIRAAVRDAHRRKKLPGSFEHGLAGWTRIGTAFPDHPVRRPTLPASVDLRTASRLGGTYASAPMPVGAVGKGWITSRRAGPKLKGLSPDARANLPVGALVSPAFRITKRYLSLRIGGQDELNGKRSLERVEIWVRKGSSAQIVKRIPAGGNERLRQETVDLRQHQGEDGVVVLVDEGTSGHVSADDVGSSGAPPLPPLEPPVLGFADTHTHAMVHQSFGGLLGHRTYMGVPGGAYTDYQRGAAGARQFAADLRDSPTHGAGAPAVRTALTAVHTVMPAMAASLHEHMHITEIHRAWEGGLRLMSSLAVSNQGLEHLTGQLEDASSGGTAASCGFTLCFDGGAVAATLPHTDDRQIIEAAAHGMRALAAMNSDWMEIVYDPEHAYEVMTEGGSTGGRRTPQGKLAIILGTEVDSLGGLGFATPEEEVDWLWRLGIRQVTPVHGIDNRIGGAAAFQDVYNSTQDLVNRRVRDAEVYTMADQVNPNGQPGYRGLAMNNPAADFGALMNTEAYGCAYDDAPTGECVSWRFGAEQTLLGLGTNRLPPPLHGPIPWFIKTDAREPPYSAFQLRDGQRNQAGLTEYGYRYIRALIHRGMLIDMEHMGDHTVDAVIASGTNSEPRGPVWDSLPGDQLGCEPGGPGKPRSVRPGCYGLAYPVMSSHTSIRGQSLVQDQSLADGVTTLPAVSHVKDNWAREFERTPRQIEYIRESGGMVAPFTGMEPTLRPPTTTRSPRGWPGVTVFRGEDYALHTNADRLDLNDCAGSSKSWITGYLYALQKMGGRGVAIATDMGVTAAGPRFNPAGTPAGVPRSCNSSYAYFDPSFNVLDALDPLGAAVREASASRLIEEAGYPQQFNRAGQAHPVVYRQRGRPYAAGSILEHVTPDGRTYDFNTQGMQTYGALPDLLQDAVNVGVAPEDLRPLMHSAQDYLDMWRKAYRVTGCDVGGGAEGPAYARCSGGGHQIDPGIGPCANTCPDSPGRGHALLPDGSPLFR